MSPFTIFEQQIHSSSSEAATQQTETMLCNSNLSLLHPLTFWYTEHHIHSVHFHPKEYNLMV